MSREGADAATLPAESAIKKFAPIAAAVCGILTMGFLVSLFRGAFLSVSDLPEFYTPAKMIAAGHGNEIYLLDKLFNVEQSYFTAPLRGVVVLFAPPAGLPWIMPLALLPPRLAPDTWKGFLCICVGLSVFLLKRSFLLNRSATCWLIAVICVSGCTYEALRIDQMSAVMFLAFSCALLALKKERPYLAALALSVFFIKPQQIIPFVVFLLGAKRYKCLAALAASLIVFSTVGACLVGIDGLHNYSTLMQSTTEDLHYLTTQISCTLRGQLVRIFPHSLTLIYWISAVVAILGYVWFFFVGRRLSSSRHWLDYGLIAVMPLGLATSLYCHYYDFLILFPTLIVLMLQFEKDLSPLVTLGGLLIAMTYVLPFSIFVHNNWLLAGHTINIHFVVLALFSAGCVALYYATMSKIVAEESNQQQQAKSVG